MSECVKVFSAQGAGSWTDPASQPCLNHVAYLKVKGFAKEDFAVQWLLMAPVTDAQYADLTNLS